MAPILKYYSRCKLALTAAFLFQAHLSAQDESLQERLDNLASEIASIKVIAARLRCSSSSSQEQQLDPTKACSSCITLHHCHHPNPQHYLHRDSLPDIEVSSPTSTINDGGGLQMLLVSGSHSNSVPLLDGPWAEEEEEEEGEKRKQQQQHSGKQRDFSSSLLIGGSSSSQTQCNTVLVGGSGKAAMMGSCGSLADSESSLSPSSSDGSRAVVGGAGGVGGGPVCCIVVVDHDGGGVVVGGGGGTENDDNLDELIARSKRRFSFNPCCEDDVFFA